MLATHIFLQDRYHAPSFGQPPSMIQSQQSSLGTLSTGNIQSSQSSMQQHSPVTHPVVPQQTPYNMLSLVPSVPGSHSTSSNHQIYNRVKTEPKSGNDGTRAAEVPVSDSVSTCVWKREVPPPGGYYSAGI